MSDGNQDYEKKCKIIKSLIMKEYEGQDIIMSRDTRTGFNVVDVNHTVRFSIMNFTNWNIVKRQISKAYETINSDKTKLICQICMEDDIKLVGCNMCAENFCVECYINIFKEGKGIVRCPFCRNEYGYLQSEDMISKSIKIIRNKQ